MKALVTGGGGFLGLYIVEQLLAAGAQVRVFCRGEYPRLKELGVECVRGDIQDANKVAAACEDIETVFHAAAVPGIWGSWSLFYGVNTIGTQNVIAGCRQHSVRRLVFTSSPSVVFDGRDHIDADESLAYPDRYPAHYPHTKALAEQAVLSANDETLSTCALRPHLIWGPRDTQLIPRLIRRAKSGRLRQIGEGRNVISVSYVENAAAAHLQAAEALEPESAAAGRAFFINEPESFGCWEWINTLLARAGLPAVQKRIPTKAAYSIGGILEFFYSICRISSEPPMTRFLAAQLSSSHSYSCANAEIAFGYNPQISVEEGLNRLEPELKALADRS